MLFRTVLSVATAAFLTSSLTGCGGAAEPQLSEPSMSEQGSDDGITIRSTSAALSIDELSPSIPSFDPLRIFFPGDKLKAALQRELLVAMQAEGDIKEKEMRLHIEEVNVDIGFGELTVKAKGEGKVRTCALGCSDWIKSTVRAEVTVGLGVRHWIVQAEHRHTDVSASNDLVDAVIRAFRGKVYGPINKGIKSALASVDGRNLRTELEAQLGFPLPAEAIVNATLAPEGLTLEAKQAPPPVERVTYLGEGQVMNPGDSVRAGNGSVRLVFQGDGNLVLYCGNKGLALWATGTVGAVDVSVMQGDGNFVLYGPSGPVWHTDTPGNPGTVLAVQDDGNVVLYAPGGRPIWETGTYRDIGRCN